MKRTFYAILFTFLMAPSLRADDLKIGIITDLSSHGAFWGKQTAIGAQILLEELKEKGSDNIQFIFADTAFKPSQAASEAHRLLDIEKVDAIYSEFSSITSAISPIVLKANKILMATTGATSFLTTNPHAFKAFLNYELGCQVLGEYWKEQGIQTAGILKVAAEFGELCNVGAKKAFPNLHEKVFNPAEDVATLLLVFKTMGLKAIFSTGYEIDNINVLKNIKTIKYAPLIGGPDSDILTDKVVESYPNELNNIATFGYQPVSDSFKNKVKQKYPSNELKAIEAAANAYTFLKQLVRALDKCEKDNIDCQMKSISAEGSDDLMKFKGWVDRQANHEFALMKINNGTKQLIRTYSLN